MRSRVLASTGRSLILDAGFYPHFVLTSTIGTLALTTNLLYRRKEPIIAIGGGVCLDVTGLAANLYRRNTPVIKVS